MQTLTWINFAGFAANVAISIRSLRTARRARRALHDAQAMRAASQRLVTNQLEQRLGISHDQAGDAVRHVFDVGPLAPGEGVEISLGPDGPSMTRIKEGPRDN